MGRVRHSHPRRCGFAAHCRGSQTHGVCFGTAIVTDGDRIFVGTPRTNASGVAVQVQGAIYVFERNYYGLWNQFESSRLLYSENVWPDHLHLGGNLALGDGFVFSSTGLDAVYEYELENGEPFCAPAANSTEDPAHLSAVGSPVVSDDHFVLSVNDSPPQVPVAFLAAPTRVQQPFHASWLCLGSGIRRLGPVLSTGPAGIAMLDVDFGNPGVAAGLLPGTTWYFQVWFEDPQSATGAPNLSNAVGLTLR